MDQTSYFIISILIAIILTLLGVLATKFYSNSPVRKIKVRFAIRKTGLRIHDKITAGIMPNQRVMVDTHKSITIDEVGLYKYYFAFWIFRIGREKIDRLPIGHISKGKTLPITTESNEHIDFFINPIDSFLEHCNYISAYIRYNEDKIVESPIKKLTEDVLVNDMRTSFEDRFSDVAPEL